jgi:hypothetical protein
LARYQKGEIENLSNKKEFVRKSYGEIKKPIYPAVNSRKIEKEKNRQKFGQRTLLSMLAYGLSSRARNVAGRLQQGAVDAYRVGQELLWTADAVPKAANGDGAAFNTTGMQSRKTMRQVWPLYQQTGMSSILKQYTPLFQPLNINQCLFNRSNRIRLSKRSGYPELRFDQGPHRRTVPDSFPLRILLS